MAALPSGSLIPELRRLAKRARLPDYDDAEAQGFNRAMEAWSKRFGALARARGAGADAGAARQFAVVEQFVKGYSDQNVIWGVLVKRPYLVGPLEEAARALRLPALAKEARVLSRLLPPPEHAGSAAKRVEWYNSRAGDRAARRADAMLMRLSSREEGVWRGLLKWALAHPEQFFSGRGGGRTLARGARAAGTGAGKPRSELAPELIERVRQVVRRGTYRTTDARRLVAEVLHHVAESGQAAGRWRTLATVAECDSAIQGDGFFHFIVNDPGLARRGAAALRRIGLTKCGAAVAAVRRNDDADSARVASLERRYQAGRGEGRFERAVLAWAAGSKPRG